MPDQPQDNLEKLSGSIYQPVQPTFNPPQQQVSGWGGKGVGIANIATQFLAGVSKGRAAAYNRQQQGEMKQVASLQSAMQAVDASGASEDVKNQQRTELFRTYGRLIQGSLPDSSKGKKGGDPAGGAEQPHPMQHILHGIKGALDSALGPAPKKNDLGPEAINATLGKVFAAISDPNNSQATQAQGAEQSLSQSWGKAVQANGGKPLTSAQIAANKDLTGVIAQYNRATGGKPGPTLTAIGNAVDTADKQSDPIHQAQLANTQSEIDLHKAQTDKAAADTKKVEEQTKTLAAGPAIKYTGELGQRVEAQRVLDDHKSPASEKKAANDTLRSLNDKQKGVEVRIENAQTKLAEDKAEKTGASVAESKYVAGGPSVANPKGELDVDVMAWEFINAGHLPFIGVRTSKVTQDKRERAIGRSGEILQDLGMSPAELPAIRGKLKSEATALGRITTMGAQVSQFEGTLEKNLTVAEQLDKAYQRHDLPFLNAVTNAFQTGTGSPEALNLAGQLHGVSREWAKIMAGSTSAAGVAIGEAKDADALMSRNMSSGQLTSFFNSVIRPDAKNRLDAVDDERKALIQKLRDPSSEVRDAGPSPTKAPPTQPGGKQASGSTPAPPAAPAGQYKFLRKDPSSNHQIGVGSDGKWHDVTTGKLLPGQ